MFLWRMLRSLGFWCGSFHIENVLISGVRIGVEYWNWRRTLYVYLLFAGANLSKSKLQTCSLQTGQSISYKYVNQFWLNWSHPNSNFDIQCQLEHFEYDMSRTLETFTTAGPALTTEVSGGICVGMEFYF